jgi:lipoyl(octanoyl) transferase
MERWLLLRSGSASAPLNMAVDETLLRHVPQRNQPVLRFYSWNEPAASFGYFQRYAEVRRATPLRPLVRRPTGGGIVPHDNDWTYSLVFPPSHPWYALKAVESYRRVHDWVRAAFEETGLAVTLALEAQKPGAGECFSGAERFDVLLQERKIAGAAQRRTRDGLLIQGSIQPPAGLARGPWEAALCSQAAKQWQVQWCDWPWPANLEPSARQLALTKYSIAAFTERR